MKRSKALRRFGIQSSWSLIAESAMLINMLAAFVVLPARLEPGEYGEMGAVQGLTMSAMQLALLGAPALLLRRISQGEDKNWSWQRATTASFFGSLLASVVLLAFKQLLLGSIDTVAYFLLILGFGYFATMGDQLFLLFMARERMDLAALTRFAYLVPRLIALVSLALHPHPSLRSWAWLNLGASATGFVICVAYAYVNAGLRTRIGPLRWFAKDCRSSYGYALTGISESVLSVSDRPVLVNSGHQADAGRYSLAYRFVGIAMVPALAVLRAGTGRIFAAGRFGAAGSLTAARKLIVPVAGISVVMSLSLFVSSPFIARYLPDQYLGAAQMIPWLAVLPLVKNAQFVAGNALDAARLQFWRFWPTVSCAGLNFALNLLFVPRYSWRAAVASTIVAETLLAVALWTALLFLARVQPMRDLGAESSDRVGSSSRTANTDQ